MKRSLVAAGTVVFLFVTGAVAPLVAATNSFPWMAGKAVMRSIAGSFLPPKGYTRTVVEPGSYADWLRNLPLKESGARVLLYNGAEKPNQNFHAAVIDIDTGTRDLQQCADAIMRLRAEYLFSVARFDAIEFRFTSGNPSPYVRWRAGYRPAISGNMVRWVRRAKPDSRYPAFRAYLDSVFTYAGTESLSGELEQRPALQQMQIGDVFIKGGSPGHALVVVDMAENRETGDKLFMIAQSYMPAQDIHILHNLNDSGLSPWYKVNFGTQLRTPEWEFSGSQLMHFKSP